MCQFNDMLLNTLFREHYKESLARLIYNHGIIPVLSEAPAMALPDHAEQMLRTTLNFEHVGHKRIYLRQSIHTEQWV